MRIDHTTTKTLAETLREAQEFGFETCRNTETGITYTIDLRLEELESEASDTVSDSYILFGHYIVHAPDAWDRNAEVYILD